MGLQKYIQCDYIVKCFGIYEYKKNNILIVLEYMREGTLFELIKDDHENLSENFMKYTLYHLALALKAMHDKNVIHRDVKTDNILVSA